MNATSDRSLLDLAADVVERAKALGASEVSVGVSEGSHVNISRRDGKVEQASEATTKRLGLSLLVDDRFSSHSTSDLRPDALDAFLTRAVAATRYLEADPARALAPADQCGRATSEEDLDHLDPAHPSHSAADRAALAKNLEDEILARKTDDFVSATTYTADGIGRSAEVTSHGFADTTEAAWFALGGTLTLRDEGSRRPEGSAYYAARYLNDLPGSEHIADEVVKRTREVVGSGPTDSGTYPMILLNRAAGRILGTLAGPISGGSIHHGRSCMAGKLGDKIGSDLLDIRDDPTIPRGLGSTPWDGDHRFARPRVVFEKGVLKTYYINTYYGRKLEMQPTTGSRSNWILPVGDQSWQELAKAFPKAILVTGFMGGNANGLTGDFSFGIRGQLLENGVATAPLSEMNISGNTLTIFQQLTAVANDPWKWSSTLSPTMIFEDISFSGT